MSIIKTAGKVIFNIWLIGVVAFAFTYVGIMLAMPLGIIGEIILGIIYYGALFAACMVFLWKLSDRHGYGLGLEEKFDKKKYLLSVLIGAGANLALASILIPIPVVCFAAAILNYYYIFPYQLFYLYMNMSEIAATYTAMVIDTPIIAAVIFLGACYGAKDAERIRESQKADAEAAEAEEQKNGGSQRKSGSWRDSVNQGE